MKSVTFYNGPALKLGLLTSKGILDIEEAGNYFSIEVPTDVRGLIEAGEIEKEAIRLVIDKASVSDRSFFHNDEEVDFGPCVDQPEKILCIGLNYRKHAEESKMPIPTTPIVFSKFANALTGHRSAIQLPEQAEKVDYEAELVIVMKKEAKDISKEEARSYVYGYCTGNDISARDLQFKTGQWLIGKTCDGFCPIGPVLHSDEEIEDPNDLAIKTIVNGEVRQQSTTADMIFNCEEIIAYLSQHMTLKPGDIIMTGTPEGVIMGHPEDNQSWLEEEDEVIVEIEKLGKLQNAFYQKKVENRTADKLPKIPL
ncbi:fumarylacetoacetate hydrolase family protein [Bacillus sp. Marseille-Q3570]|uniref:fumarylacetoacetate hydrolase family protein n=1 Tax=Bacillus sp. Marseille-Q3570 TaxID=2963522 RepID=UPI0021B74CFC|nr:fumarylacetoacetate hydrolase family protein [Bacillus sp. Marseille-Q3570]